MWNLCTENLNSGFCQVLHGSFVLSCFNSPYVHVDGVRRCLWTAATNGPTVHPPCDIRVCTVTVKLYWHEKTEKLGEKSVKSLFRCMQSRGYRIFLFSQFSAPYFGNDSDPILRKFTLVHSQFLYTCNFSFRFQTKVFFPKSSSPRACCVTCQSQLRVVTLILRGEYKLRTLIYAHVIFLYFQHNVTKLEESKQEQHSLTSWPEPPVLSSK
jgi:hypothetical protein